MGGLFRSGWGEPSPGFAAALPMGALSHALSFAQGLLKEGGRALTYWAPLMAIPAGLGLLACPNPIVQAEHFQPRVWKVVLAVLCVVGSVIFFSGVETFIYANF